MKIIWPKEIESLIIDYYYSHKIFAAKRRIQREMQFHQFFRQVRSYYELYHHITVSFGVNGITLLETEYTSDDDMFTNLIENPG